MIEYVLDTDTCIYWQTGKKMALAKAQRFAK
jgi:hypothetical protein